MQTGKETTRREWLNVALYFLKLGTTAFGGPAAHIALMHDGLVTRKKWLTDQEFLDLNSAANLIPGPNSTELAIHIGYLRAGWRGLLAAGVSFILPAMLIVMALAWAYVEFGATPQAAALFYGIQPVVIVIVAQALWVFGRTAVKNTATAVVGVAAIVFYFLGVNELLLLLLAGISIMLVENWQRVRQLNHLIPFPLTPSLPRSLTPSPFHLFSSVPHSLPLSIIPSSFSLPLLFLTFLKIGSVLYGSGYVLLVFLRADFVQNLGWLTEKQLLDAVAVGQITPGPVFTTATFIGYILGGVPGALLATLGIFLPSFIFVALTHPLIPRMRQSKLFSGLLDGVNVASAALMAGVTVQLARAALVDVPTIAIALVAALLLFRFKLNPTWLVLGGALAGLVLTH